MSDFEKMEASYNKLGVKMLVRKYEQAKDPEEIDLIASILDTKGFDTAGNPVKKSGPKQVIIEPEEIDPELEAITAGALEDDALITSAKAAEKIARAQQKAELDADLVALAKARAKEERAAKIAAAKEARRQESIENRRRFMESEHPVAAAALDKRVAFMSTDKETKEPVQVVGRVCGLVNDRRTSRVLMRIAGDNGQVYHKIETSPDVFFVEQVVDTEDGKPVDSVDADGKLVLIEREGTVVKARFGAKELTSEEQEARLKEAEARRAARFAKRCEAWEDRSPYGVQVLDKRVALKAFGKAFVVKGTVIGLTYDARVNKTLIKVKGDDGKVYHKVDTSRELFLLGENDELIERDLPTIGIEAIQGMILKSEDTEGVEQDAQVVDNQESAEA